CSRRGRLRGDRSFKEHAASKTNGLGNRSPRNAAVAFPDDVVPVHAVSDEFEDTANQNARAAESELAVAHFRVCNDVPPETLRLHWNDLELGRDKFRGDFASCKGNERLNTNGRIAGHSVCPRFSDRGFRKRGPVRFAAKQKPHRPGIAPALGLRAGRDVSSLYRRPSEGAYYESSPICD